MREVIRGLIEAEGEARAIVQAARGEADGLRSEAKKRAQEMLAQAQQAARVEAARTLDLAMEVAEQERQKRLERATAAIQSQVQLDETARDRFADAVVRCICGQA